MNDIIGKLAIIIIGIPLVFFTMLTIISLKQDNTSQSYIDNAVVEFVDNARASARISPTAYEKLVEKINIAHSPCTIEIWHSAKYTVPNLDAATGEYESMTANEDFSKMEILNYMYPDNFSARDYELKEGDFLQVTVTADSPTLGSRMAGVFLPGYNKKNLFTAYGGYIGNEVQ